MDQEAARPAELDGGGMFELEDSGQVSVSAAFGGWNARTCEYLDKDR